MAVKIPKFIDDMIFPDRVAKHWKLFNKYNGTKNRIRRFFLLVRIRKLQRRFNASIPVSNKIKPFYTPHGLSGIFISAAATIDEGCTIFQNVTVGSNTIKGHPREGGPQIGKGVLIGANCGGSSWCLGSRRRSRGCSGSSHRGSGFFGAGCALATDLPAGATAVSQAPRIIEGDINRDNTFRTVTDSMNNK